MFSSLNSVSFSTIEEVSRKYNVAVLKQGATLIDEIYGRIGNLTQITTEVQIVGINSNLLITNNNNYNIQVSYARMAL